LFPRGRYVESCMKVICGRKDLVHIPLARRYRQARLEWTIEYALWKVQIGDTFCSLMSPDSSYTSQMAC
jgi:hypothetical protein